jgi:hypothetical protein
MAEKSKEHVTTLTISQYGGRGLYGLQQGHTSERGSKRTQMTSFILL